MAALSTQEITNAGIVPSYAAAAGGGDTFSNTGNEFLHVKNGGGGSVTVTIASSGKYKGATIADQTVTVANGSEKMIKPYGPEVTSNTAAVAYSGVASVTVAVVAFKP